MAAAPCRGSWGGRTGKHASSPVMHGPWQGRNLPRTSAAAAVAAQAPATSEAARPALSSRARLAWASSQGSRTRQRRCGPQAQLPARRRGPCGRPEGIWKSLSSLLTRHQHPPAGEPVQSPRVLCLHCYFVQLNRSMSTVMCRRTVMRAHARCLAKCQQAEVAVTGKNILHKVCSYSICQ